MQRLLKRLAISIAIIMFIIIVMGALVTKTESGLGCGYEWPLCNGKFVPAYTISSMIEYSHRAVVALFTFLLVITTLLVFVKSGRKDAKWLSGGAVFFTLLQAAMGALAVVFPQSPPVLALHFGLSLLAYTFCFLLALVLNQSTTSPSANQSNDNLSNRVGLEAGLQMKFDLKFLIWGILIYTYVVVYLGAFVRHTQSSGGCSGWPLCNGELIPKIEGATGIVFIHRVAAFCLVIAVLVLYLIVRRRYEKTNPIVRTVNWISVFLGLQVFSGAIVTLVIADETYYLFSAMVHAVIITILFGFMSYLGLLTLWKRPANTT